jgi:hypothetical protein
MRKRILIALLAIVVIGVGAFVLTRTKERTVEWHKQKYWEARERKTWRHSIYRAWYRTFGSPDRDYRFLDRFVRKGLDTHERQLIRLGYLEERTFTASNVHLSEFQYAAHIAARNTNFEFYSVRRIATNVFRVVNLKGTLPTMEQVLAELDSAANKNQP